LNKKGFDYGYEKHLTNLQQILRHVFNKQHRRYLIYSKNTLLRNAVNEIENHIIKDVIQYNKAQRMKKLQEKNNAQCFHFSL